MRKLINWRKNKIEEITLSTANEFAVQLVLELSERYSIALEKVFDIFTEMNYWRVINNAEVCCELAHDGLQSTIEDIGKWFESFTKTNKKPNTTRKPFESQSITIVKHIVENDHLSREDAIKLWFSSKTYKEIIRRNLTYISAMRAYFELELEHEKSPDWMKQPFE